MKIILSVFIVIAVLVWARAFKAPGVKQKARGDRKGLAAYSGEGQFASLISINPAQRERTKSSYADWGRNPFEIYVGGQAKKIILHGILTDEKTPRALINDHYVAKGDRMGEYTIVDIRRDRVILNDGTKDIELKLGE